MGQVNNDFGYYRNCKDCNNLVKRDYICKGVKHLLEECKEYHLKDTGVCEYFKRKWWKIWVPK